MPVYVFECPKCKDTVELLKSIKDETCPMCCAEGCDGNVEMVNVIVGTTFHLKGLGWAAEGYDKSGAT
jgi:predicted nucleic acid-binding Zn ribbon protein